MVDKLLDGVVANTTGDAFIADGGDKCVHIFGDNYDGGTITLQGSADNSHWTTLKHGGNPAEFTEDDIVVIDRLGQGMRVRATLTGATTAVNVNAWMFQ